MALPFLPGNSFNPSLGKGKYHKSHHFDKSNDVAMMVGEEKPGIGGDLLPGQRPRTNHSVIPRGNGPDLPAWVAFDRQVLCFDGYFQEAVHEKREEQYRVRHCKIYFYLEDDSIQVIEPRMKNAGVPQGTLIRRHRVPRPPPHDDTFYTVEDLNINKEIIMYSRKFCITDCDEFTANFMKKLGVRVNSNKSRPNDPYMSHRKAMDESMQPLRPYEKHDTLKQFLDHDRHVLRFFCHWDDRDSMFGDPRQMVLHYFLADDTIEIRETIPANSGRDATPMFLRRAKLPKIGDSLRQPGEITDRTVLNVFGPTGHGGRYILDSLKTGAVSQEFYNCSDLTIGATLNIWGRKFIISDCDDFTKEYYRTKYGITDFASLGSGQAQGKEGRGGREVPPYNGWGSEEDSLCSCMALLPKPPKRDFIKFMEKDRHGLDSNVLRFLGKMESSKALDSDRRFIISYFLSDDTILVFEPQMRNSGMIGGKFLERGRVKKPNQPSFSTQLSEYYTAQDLFVGATVIFNNHRFLLIDADEYAYCCMERHPEDYVVSNMDKIMGKICGALQGKVDDINRQALGGCVSFDEFRRVLHGVLPGVLTEHEIITLARFYQDRKDDALDVNTLIAVAQEQLRKNNFENFSRVQEQCIHYDKERNSYLDLDSIRKVCQALRVGIQDDLLRALLSRMPTNEAGLINYGDFIQQINWRDHPVAAVPQGTCAEGPDSWQVRDASQVIERVNVAALVEALSGH